MEVVEAQKLVMESLEKKKGKSKFYLKDFYAMLPDWKPREVNKLVNNMVQQGMLEYWSSGSTTLYGIKGAGKQGAAEEGEE
ncbi:MAG: dissimilatory sulfite reductase-asociated protein DsvD [Desulfobacca sp.]|nr:dissimilatory sulfite reductase-asociated protein DsvD [Desulfobacca sp.]